MNTYVEQRRVPRALFLALPRPIVAGGPRPYDCTTPPSLAFPYPGDHAAGRILFRCGPRRLPFATSISARAPSRATHIRRSLRRSSHRAHPSHRPLRPRLRPHPVPRRRRCSRALASAPTRSFALTAPSASIFKKKFTRTWSVTSLCTLTNGRAPQSARPHLE